MFENVSCYLTLSFFVSLLRFMSGELQLNNVAQPAAAPAPMAQNNQVPMAAAVATQTPTPVVELKHMITQEDLEDDAEYNDILEDTRDECSSFGTLKNIIIPRTGPGATKIFLEYLTAEDAKKAIVGLGGRTFDGRQVEAMFYDEIRFANQDYA